MPTRVASAPRHELTVVANRLPVSRVGGSWRASGGGVARALLPSLRDGGAWVGWTGRANHAPAPFAHGPATLVPLSLSKDDVERFYLGFSNDVLWPLYHGALRPAPFRRDWWATYADVNDRYAALVEGLAEPGGTVWVHDYQLQLVPRLVRERRPDVRIGYFLHIPFPPLELFSRLPSRVDVLEGMLGADLIGFQTELAASNFVRAATSLVGVRPEGNAVRVGARRVEVGVFPISIDVDEVDQLAADPATEAQALDLRERVGSPRRLLLGVDRLDYTKGIDARLMAFRRFLAERRPGSEDCVLVQVAVPSRESLHGYAAERERVERLVGEINGAFGSLGRPVVHYLHGQMALPELVALYRAADALLVTPWSDGMNLVCKEYVAARRDERGALVLSEFAGAATELPDALLVNPWDEDGLVAALSHATTLSPAEAARRMRRMRTHLFEHDVHRWSEDFLESLRPRPQRAGLRGA